MKIYEIRDEELRESVGILIYYERSKTFIIELKDDLDEWTAPLLFTGYVKKGIFTIPASVSCMWVRERIIPSGRQNIDSILNNSRLKEYDEMKFLEISKGKCSQDNLYIQKTDELPEYVRIRMKRNLIECVLTHDNCLLCFFADNTVRRIDLHQLKQVEGVEKILGNRQLIESVKVGPGGYSANFGECIDIPSGVLYSSGTLIPLSLNDFLDFVRNNIYDTTESCAALGCSRQNLAYIQEKGLTPVKENVKGSLFLKGDILRTEY